MATRNIDLDIKKKEKLINENEKTIKALNIELNRQYSSSIKCRTYCKLLTAKRQLEDEIFENNMKIDVLSQHRKTSLTAQYLNETFSLKSKSTDDR